MPDLSIVIMRQCKQLSYWEGEVNGYNVVCGQRVCSCTCPSFVWKRGLDNHGHCKHITQALAKEVCTWHEQWSAETINNDLTCPQCGGETEAVKVGV